MSFTQIPHSLKQVIGEEPADFIIKAKWNHPRHKVKSLIITTLFWNTLVGIFLYIVYAPLLLNGEVSFTSNDEPVTASWNNLKPLLMPTLILGVFFLVGIILLIWTIVSHFQKGGYFAATPTRLIKYRKGKLTITDWEQFTGNTRIIINNRGLGTLEFLLRTGKMNSQNDRKQFVPDKIEIAGIPTVLQIENICRKRIKENDPTPTNIE